MIQTEAIISYSNFFFFSPSEHTVTLLFSQETDGENEEGLHLLL